MCMFFGNKVPYYQYITYHYEGAAATLPYPSYIGNPYACNYIETVVYLRDMAISTSVMHLKSANKANNLGLVQVHHQRLIDVNLYTVLIIVCISSRWVFEVCFPLRGENRQSNKYSFLMHGIKSESFGKFISEWKTSIYVWVYQFAAYVVSLRNERSKSQLKYK